MVLAHQIHTSAWTLTQHGGGAHLDVYVPAGAAEGSIVHPVNLEIVTTHAGLDALAADWNALFERAATSAHVFQSHAWCRHWADAFLDDGGTTQLAVLTGSSGGRLVMVWPLVTTRVAGLRELSWLGEPVSQYGDVLADPGPDQMRYLEEGWRHIVKTVKPAVVRLNKTRADAVVAPLLARLNARVTQRLDAPYLNLASAPDWASYEQRYGAKALKNRRRQLRRLEEQGPVTVVHCTAGAQAQTLAREALELKRAWLRDKGLVSPALTDERTRLFFNAITADPAQSGCVRVSALTAGDQTAAISIGFACKDRLAVHLIVYARAFEKAAAGSLLLERSMKAAHEEGFATYDMLAPGGGYKTEWADASVEVCDYSLPLTKAGSAYARLYLEIVRPRLKAAAFALESLKRRLTRSWRSVASKVADRPGSAR